MSVRLSLILASASPRRLELLRSAGVEPRVMPVDADETWQIGERPLDYVLRVAQAKATLAASRVDEDDALILAADTTVWIADDREPLGKPADPTEARAMLRVLTSGAPHFVTTACAFVRVGATASRTAIEPIQPVIETAEVTMRRLDDAAFERFIGPYLAAGDWHDKAGAYAIQGRAAGLVERIVGSYTTIVGLPLAQVLARLDACLEASRA